MFPLLLSLALASGSLAQSTPVPGSIVEVGDTRVSAMMLLVGNEDKVYILDKVENNAEQINGHPAWAAEWDIATNKATLMDMTTNVFCAAGIFMPNGTWATFGGNNAVGPGCPANGAHCASDSTYGDADGATAVRLLTPCTDSTCVWNDGLPAALQKRRWYPGVEVLADGSSVLMGGFSNGGFVNRNVPNTDPRLEGGAAEPTYEFWPAREGELQDFNFLIKTSGLNSYAHAYLMPSGKMFVQANLSTVMWDYNSNTETPLPDMPNGVVRVYPGSGGVAMLPLTPDNDYTPTIIFCGGNNMSEEMWGDYAAPVANTFDIPSSTDCQRITPEPADSSVAVAYEQDDDMPDPRSMGQFVILPDETLLMVNGGAKGTAGYSDHTGSIPNLAGMPFGMSLASEPVLQPAIYNPTAPKGQRWSKAGLGTSKIPRLYHSSAVLLPDGSVLIAGSNPNVDVNLTTVFPTTYKAERFYPMYFSASTRPTLSGIPSTLSYGGAPFDLTLNSSSYSGDANDAAAKTKVVIVRSGFSTHAMNMGQKALRLNSTYTVADDGTITIHTSQLPPNPNLYQPGPTFLYVVVDGVPSIGKMVIVGSGNIEQQPTKPIVALQASTNSTKSPTGSGSDSSSSKNNDSGALSMSVSGLLALISTLTATFVLSS